MPPTAPVLSILPQKRCHREREPRGLAWRSRWDPYFLLRAGIVVGTRRESTVPIGIVPSALLARSSAGVRALGKIGPASRRSSAKADGPRRIGSGFQPDPASGFRSCPPLVRANKAFGIPGECRGHVAPLLATTNLAERCLPKPPRLSRRCTGPGNPLRAQPRCQIPVTPLGRQWTAWAPSKKSRGRSGLRRGGAGTCNAPPGWGA